MLLPTRPKKMAPTTQGARCVRRDFTYCRVPNHRHSFGITAKRQLHHTVANAICDLLLLLQEQFMKTLEKGN